MPVYERLSMVVSLALIGLALYFVIELPPQTTTITLFGLSIALTASTRLLMAILLSGLTFTGAGAVMRAHPGKRISYAIPFWVNAVLIVVLAALTLARLGGALTWALGLLVTGALLWFSILAEYRVIPPGRSSNRWARLWSQGMSYALMLAYAVLIYQSQMGIVLRLASIFAVAGLLASSLFKLHAIETRYVGLFSFLTAIALSQFAWVLTFWPINAAEAALLTFLVFYILSGLIGAHFKNRLSRQTIIEYAAVTLVGLALIVWGNPF